MSQSQKSKAKAKFDYREKLLTKGITTDTLLKKLKALHEELSQEDKDFEDKSVLDGYRTELIHRSILFHKDPGVKAYAACCIADILRYYAPNAPYDPPRLKDIFAFILNLISSQLRPSKTAAARGGAAAAPQHPTKSEFYNQYYYLLEKLATCKSVVLMLNAEEQDEDGLSGGGGGEDSLVVKLFRIFFDLVRYELPRTLTDYMLDILTSLIDEAGPVTPEIRSILLQQFEDDRMIHHPRCLELAIAVCEHEYKHAPADKVGRSFANYFTEILVDPSTEHPNSSSEDISEPESSPKRRSPTKQRLRKGAKTTHAASLSTLNHAHTLMRSIARHCPLPFLFTLVVLEEELQNPDQTHRFLAVETMGEVWCGPRGSEVVSKSRKSWNAWLDRSKEADRKIRKVWVEKVGKLLGVPGSGGLDLKAEVEPLLRTKLNDGDEFVRETACRVLGHLDYEDMSHHVSKETLQILASRMTDKKNPVRGSAIHSIGRIYSLAYPEIEDGDAQAIDLFAWIPNELIKSMRVSPSPAREVIEQSLLTYILPLPAKGDDEVIWVDRLLLVMRHLEPTSKEALLFTAGFNKLKIYYSHLLRAFVEYNGGTIDENEETITRRLNSIIAFLQPSFPDGQKAATDLKKFADENEGRLYKLLKAASDEQTDLKTLVKINAEFAKRCPADILPTMTIILRRTSFPIINRTSIPTLIQRLCKTGPAEYKDAAKVASENARLILTTISKWRPIMYKSHIAELGRVIQDSPTGAGVVDVPLQALSHLEKADSSTQTADKKILDKALALAQYGSAREAKFAARLIAFSKRSDELSEKLAETLAALLNDDHDESLHAHIVALAELARSAPDALETQIERVLKFILDNFAQLDEDHPAKPGDWEPDENLTPKARAKLAALKLCSNRCVAHATTEGAVQVATPVLKLFLTILNQPLNEPNPKGYFATSSDGCNIKARVRLQAAECLLRLAKIKVYEKLISQSFLVLALMVQDPCYMVRHRFIIKLGQGLENGALPATYNVMLYLAAYDEAENRDLAKKHIQRGINGVKHTRAHGKVDDYIYPFVRLLHVLAHHPDYSDEPKEIAAMAKYIEFYLEIILDKDNVSLLYALAGKMKTIRDRQAEYSQNLYAIGEYAQYLIQIAARAHSWTIESFPGHIKMPGDIFATLSGPEEIQKNLIREYLPKEISKELKDRLSRSEKDAKSGARRPLAPAIARTAVKRRAPAKPVTGTSKAKRRRSTRAKTHDSTDEDEEESESEEEEEEEEEVVAPKPKKKAPAQSPARKAPTRPTNGRAKRPIQESDEEGEKEDAGAEEETMDEDREELPEVFGRRSVRQRAAAKTVTPKKSKAKSAPKPKAKSRTKAVASDGADSDDLTPPPVSSEEDEAEEHKLKPKLRPKPKLRTTRRSAQEAVADHEEMEE